MMDQMLKLLHNEHMPMIIIFELLDENEHCEFVVVGFVFVGRPLFWHTSVSVQCGSRIVVVVDVVYVS